MVRVVLVTGCSSGIGEALALYLERRGWRVYAGVRTDADVERLERIGPRVTALPLDVTNRQQVEAAVDRIDEVRLDGLVNNAGIGVGGPVEWVPLDDWRRQLEVNVLGPVGMLQATLPLLRASHGRVLLIGSMSGRISTPLTAPYCASKAAVRALADALRLELRESGVAVSLIEPGQIKSRIFAKARDDLAQVRVIAPREIQDRYRRSLSIGERLLDLADERALPPSRAASVIYRALTAKRPRPYYRVGIDARAAELVARLAPGRARDWILERGMGLLDRAPAAEASSCRNRR